MVLKNAIATALCTGLLMSGSAALADEYRAAEFLGLDLSQAVLSPKRLGPETQFAPVRIEAKSDHAQVEPKPEPKTVRTVRVTEAPAVKRVAAAPPRAAARTKLARRHSNPLDAQASDTRIQTWPCKSGGICGWQR
jgi:hypothetical protein